jgi:hypothetical protein
MNFREEEIKSSPNNIPKQYNSTSDFSTSTTAKTNNTDEYVSSFFDYKTYIIFFLLAFLVLTFLGINLFTILGNSIQELSNVFGPFFINFTKSLGYSTGTLINTSADTVSDAAQTTIEIAEDSVQNIGNLMITAAGDQAPESEAEAEPELETSVQTNTTPPVNNPQPDDSTNSIQNPISADKRNWCLVGEYQSKRGCVAIGDSDKCLSGQIFPNQAMCLNPTLTP